MNREDLGKLIRSLPLNTAQRQDSLLEQLLDLQLLANRLGMYDAADFLTASIDKTQCRGDR